MGEMNEHTALHAGITDEAVRQAVERGYPSPRLRPGWGYRPQCVQVAQASDADAATAGILSL